MSIHCTYLYIPCMAQQTGVCEPSCLERVTIQKLLCWSSNQDTSTYTGQGRVKDHWYWHEYRHFLFLPDQAGKHASDSRTTRCFRQPPTNSYHATQTHPYLSGRQLFIHHHNRGNYPPNVPAYKLYIHRRHAHICTYHQGGRTQSTCVHTIRRTYPPNCYTQTYISR